MYKKRILSICCISLIFFSILTPTIDCIGSENEIKNYNQSNYTTSHDGLYLVVYPKKMDYEGIEKIDGEEYAIYNSNYTIKNIGDESSAGREPVILVRHVGWVGEGIFDYWSEENLTLEPGESINLSHEVKIRSRADLDVVSYRDERFLADNRIIMETGSGNVDPEKPDSSIIRAKYWNNKSDYQPTLAHLLVSTPWRYQKGTIEINEQELFYLKLPKLNRLPEIIKNNRMGWIKDLSFNLDDLLDSIRTILNQKNNDFVLESWDKLENVNSWIMDISNCFSTLVYGTQEGKQLNLLLDDFENIKTQHIKPIENISKSYYQKIIPPVKKLVNDSTKLCEWINKTPWTKQITIQGQINGIKNNEIIKITCRNITKIYRDEDDNRKDNVVHFNFTLPREKDNLDTVFLPLNCNISVEGDKHGRYKSSKNRIQTRCKKANEALFSEPLLSYCFSNGKIFFNFTADEWNEENQGLIIQILTKLFNWLKERPFFNYIKKLYDSKVNLNQQKEDHQQVNTIVSKPYYLGAPMNNPYIAYYNQDEVIVRFNKNVKDINEVNGFLVIDRVLDLKSVLVRVTGMDPIDFIDLVKERDDVINAELNWVGHGCNNPPNDEYWNEQWGHRAINCEEAWEITMGQGVTIAVLDSGVDFDHEDIPGEKFHDQYDYVNKDSYAIDDLGHGTMCTGLILAQHDNKGIAGIAPKCDIIPLKIINEYNNFDAFTLGKAIIDISKSADIISMSLCIHKSVHSDDRSYLDSACDYASDKALLVVSADNNNIEIPDEWIPAAFDSTLTVGAIDTDLKRWSEGPTDEGSNYGNHLDIMAPGKDIFSTHLGNKYGNSKGRTSAAAAYVSGVAALVMSTEITNDYDFIPNGLWDPEEVKKKLLYTTVKESYMDDFHYGAGVVNAYKAVIPGSPVLTLNPDSWDVKAEVGKDKSEVFTWKNSGTGWAEEISVSLTGDLDDFYFSDDSEYSTELCPRGTDSVKIIFKPTSEGRKEAILHISSEECEELTANLVGHGKPKAKSLHVSPQTHVLVNELQNFLLKFFDSKNFGV